MKTCYFCDRPIIGNGVWVEHTIGKGVTNTVNACKECAEKKKDEVKQ